MRPKVAYRGGGNGQGWHLLPANRQQMCYPWKVADWLEESIAMVKDVL